MGLQAGGQPLQHVVPPAHDVPLEELTRKLRAVWASVGASQDPTALKQVRRAAPWQGLACLPAPYAHDCDPTCFEGSECL